MPRSRLLALVGLATLLASRSAQAEVDAPALIRALRNGVSKPLVLPAPLRASGQPDRLPIVVELSPGASAEQAGLVAIGGRFAAGSASAEQIETLAVQHPDWRVRWAPPRRPLLDLVAGWVRVEPFRARTGGTGQGAIVGIVDTGIDLAHPDLRDAAGRTRARWLIDFSRGPEGRQPELERHYKCTEAVKCAIFDQDDLEELLNNTIIGDTPTDTLGHGTHVASLAAGNGLSSDPPRFVGVAPEAQLIAARVTRGVAGDIHDSDILIATQFIFDRAAELGLPAVVNLSLGSDFGPHDGSSALEAGLASLVGPTFPGRAIVVAAGNSGGVFLGVAPGYPDPIGIHTQVHVPRASRARVPILTFPTNAGEKRDRTEATVFVWLTFRPEDEVRVGLDRDDSTWIRPIEPGDGATFEEDGLAVTIVNDAPGPNNSLPDDGNSAIVVLDGEWASGETFALQLEGHGTAELWVQAEGELGPLGGSLGALFPRALKQGTINVPASHPDLIAVGATTNRTEWIDFAGQHISFTRNGALDPSPPDTPAFFSAAGPTSTGLPKPDIVAPGMLIAGAMSNSADPRDNASMFSGRDSCPPNAAGRPTECFIIDNRHAIASGTSMAAPIAAGAVALLLEQRPDLTQRDVLRLLQAGARKLQGIVRIDPRDGPGGLEQQAGPGALDVNGAFDALSAAQQPILREPLREES